MSKPRTHQQHKGIKLSGQLKIFLHLWSFCLRLKCMVRWWLCEEGLLLAKLSCFQNFWQIFLPESLLQVEWQSISGKLSSTCSAWNVSTNNFNLDQHDFVWLLMEMSYWIMRLVHIPFSLTSDLFKTILSGQKASTNLSSVFILTILPTSCRLWSSATIHLWMKAGTGRVWSIHTERTLPDSYSSFTLLLPGSWMPTSSFTSHTHHLPNSHWSLAT